MRLSHYFGNSPELCLNAQRELDLWEAECQPQAELKQIKPTTALESEAADEISRLTGACRLGRIRPQPEESTLKTTSIIMAIALGLATTVGAQEAQAPAVTDAPPAQTETGAPGYVSDGGQFAVRHVPECRQIRKGGPIAGIVVASVFWWFLPMSIPVWVTQAKKLKRRKAEIYEQRQRGCP